VAGFSLYLKHLNFKNNSDMSDELLIKKLKQQEEFIDMLRFKVEALEAVLKNHVPNFEDQYARHLALFDHNQKKRIKESRDRLDDQ
jgi:hypothetical protein